MHNWGFLLLAFVAVFKPIASYTERGLVDGRQQRCDYRTASVLREPGVHFHGTYRFSKPAVEDRRLTQRSNAREIRQNEVREESLRRISSPDRRLVDNLERGGHTPTRLGSFSQAESRLARDGVNLQRETRGPQLSDLREERNQVRSGHLLTNHGSRRTLLDSRQSNSRLSEDESRSRIRLDGRRSSTSRLSMELRRDTLGDRDTQTQRDEETRETRIVSDRARDDITRPSRIDRRIARERTQRMDMQRSESRLQLNRISNRGIQDQRFKETELRSSPMSSARIYRTYDNNDESRMATRANTQSLDRRDERRSIQYRRFVEEKTQRRDIGRNRVTINRDSVSAYQRDIRQVDRNGKTTILQSDRTTESRRDLRQTATRSLGRDRSVENRRVSRHVERDTARSEPIRFVENRDSQMIRRDSQIMERERSVTNRRDSLHSVENRRASRSADRARFSDSRKETRNIARESRTATTNEAAKNKRDVRTLQLDLARSIEVGREAHKNNRDSCLMNSERSTGRQVANRNREVVAKILTADRSAENQRNARTYRRDTRHVARESRVLERNRIVESLRNTRMNLRDARSLEREDSRRDSQNTESRVQRVARIIRVEANNDQRVARDFERQTRSVERSADYRRDTRGNEREVRNIGLKQFSEARDSRAIHRDSRVRAISLERGEARIQRAVRSFREERSSESRRDVRKVDRDFRMFDSERLAESRRERATEIRRDIRNTERDARTVRTFEERRVESRIVNAARSRDNLSMERRNYKMAERLNMRDTSLENRRSRSVQRDSRTDSRRVFERNNVETERREVESPTRKREFLGMIAYPAKDENEASTMNWQYIFYALQGLYICGVLTQLMNERSAVKKPRALSWWPASQHLIKAD